MITHKDANRALVEAFNAEHPIGHCVVFRKIGIAWDVARTTGPAFIDATDASVVPVAGRKPVPLGMALFVISTSDVEEALAVMLRQPERVLELLAQQSERKGLLGILAEREDAA